MTQTHHSPLYQRAGVDIKKGESLVDAIKDSTQQTKIPGCVGNIGGFGALFDLKAAGIKDPILVSCTDGVGTKLLAAIKTNHHTTIGIDLVAMCVNDLAVQGAIPLFFLDYIASSHLREESTVEIVEGIAHACKEAHCALTGGEMAEMPGMYHDGHYDLAGFCVGAADRGHMLPKNISQGDTIIGLPSHGIHANGFSLVRKILEENHLTFKDKAPFASHQTLGDVLLTPTRIYVSILRQLHQKQFITGAAHITGGGLYENIPRILSKGYNAVIDRVWPIPPLFKWLARAGHVSIDEMLRVFNCGLGMVVTTPIPQKLLSVLQENGEEAFVIGHVEKSHDPHSKPIVEMKNPPSFTQER